MPLILIAGQPLTTSTTRMKASARAGITAPTPPTQRMACPFRIPARSAATTLRGSGSRPAPPSGRTTGADAVIVSARDLGDLGFGQGDDGRGQRLEVHRCELRGAARDRPVEERLDVLRQGGTGLRGVHDGVLVVDDRVG